MQRRTQHSNSIVSSSLIKNNSSFADYSASQFEVENKKDKMDNTVVINISGTKFEVSRNTFNNMMSTESDAKLKLGILKENNPSCYFLERNFEVFTAVLSYFQGNGLHVPALTCIAEFKKELDFWGIDPHEIEPCCYSKYIGFFDDQKALTILTDDQTERINERTELQRRVKEEGWISFQAKVWSVLEEPSFNIFAKVGIQESLLLLLLNDFAICPFL